MKNGMDTVRKNLRPGEVDSKPQEDPRTGVKLKEQLAEVDRQASLHVGGKLVT